MCPDAVVISEYNKGFLTPGKMHMIAQFCWANKIPLFADSKSLLSDWSRKITFVKINEVEFQAHLDKGLSPWQECQHLLVTKGGAGIDLYGQDGTVVHHADAHGGNIIDVAGAGDTVIAALVVNYLETGDIKQAMEFSMRAASVAVSKRGVVAVKREEVV
jgi:bifunctional ADP-heptose synthase (sugar kinase/adenylyltransferase)